MPTSHDLGKVHSKLDIRYAAGQEQAALRGMSV